MHTSQKLLVASLVVLALVSLPTGAVAADGLAPTAVSDAPDDVAASDLGAVGPSGGVLAATDDVTADCHIHLVESPECKHDEDNPREF